MLRNFAYGGLALIGGAITGIAISSWAAPLTPPQIGSEVIRVAQPAMASTSSQIANNASDCSPWEVSDVAMEATLNEMIRRGWRPPTQAEVIEASYGGASVAALNPDASVPVRYAASVPSSDDIGATEATEPFPVDQVLSATPPATPGAGPSLTSAPAPAIVIEEPAPASN